MSIAKFDVPLCLLVHHGTKHDPEGEHQRTASRITGQEILKNRSNFRIQNQCLLQVNKK